MLSQHIITKPVFDALFEGYAFAKMNPVSQQMEKMMEILEDQALEKETEILQKFYESVRERAKGIDNAEGKQKIINLKLKQLVPQIILVFLLANLMLIFIKLVTILATREIHLHLNL